MEKSKKTSAIVLSVLIVCAAIVFIVAILPHMLSYKCASPCARVESDANNIAAAISDYFAIPEHTDIKPADIAGSFTPWNSWTFIQCGERVYIYVYDLKEDCPVDYQNVNPEWDSHIYTKIIQP